MPVIKLLRTSTLTITRFDAQPELLESGKYSGVTTSTFDIQCSLQPFKGIAQKVLPDGYKADDARLVYTQTKLNTTSQFTKVQADETQIDGLTYECFLVEDWNQFNLSTDHYRCIFVRKDQAV